tara:strand:+ start:66767 stop:67264 length:498 start_codon:yes stop_codon:yes gene_type:complete
MITTLVLGTAACGDMGARLGLGQARKDAPAAPAAPTDASEPMTALTPAAAPVPSSSATTAEALDTTTPEQRAAATRAPSTAGKALGKTVVSLGSPTEPGLWLKTPLVRAETAGRVTNPANGKSAAVMLIPIEGPATAGSRMSLAALRLIDASLADLTTVEVSTAE